MLMLGPLALGQLFYEGAHSFAMIHCLGFFLAPTIVFFALFLSKRYDMTRAQNWYDNWDRILKDPEQQRLYRHPFFKFFLKLIKLLPTDRDHREFLERGYSERPKPRRMGREGSIDD